jgi:pilus assembly protein CpaB
MNRGRLLLIGFVALALGTFVSVMVYRTLQAKSSGSNEPGTNVVIAAADIPVGAKLEDKDVKVVRLPAADLPPNAFHQKSSVLGRGAVVPINKGEFILTNKLAAENSGYGLPSLIPPGMRAVSVRVNEVVSVAGFVQPGTRVDVLLTGTASGSGDPQTTTVLENVAVIANGQRLERTAAGEASNAPVITLLVSPDDAQKLTLASTQGKIQLALRNPVDTKAQDLAAVRSAALYKNAAPAPPTAIRRAKGKPAAAPPAVPAVYQVEVIRGDKKDITKF